MSVLDATMETLSVKRVRYVRPVSRVRAVGLVAEVYTELDLEFQVVPPITVHSPVPRLLAAVWSAARETLVVGDGRIEKEAVAAAVSAANACPFCVDVHSVMLEAGSQREVASALLTGRAETVPDPGVRALVTWGLSRPFEAGARASPFPADRAAAYRGTAVVFHYVNRVVNVFMRDGSPLAMPRGLAWLRGPMSRIAAGSVGRATLVKSGKPGASLGLLADLDVTSGVPWIDSHSTVGPALARLFHVARSGGAAFLSVDALRAVDRAIERWDGEDPPLGRQWLEEALSELPVADRSAPRLALAVARAAYVVDDDLVDAFLQVHASEQALVSIVAFGAAAAARRIATLLAPETEGT